MAKNTFSDGITYKLVAPTVLKSPREEVRFYHIDDAKRWWTVSMTADRKVTCWCMKFWNRYQTGEGELCEHVESAIEFRDIVGWKGMPTWAVK